MTTFKPINNYVSLKKVEEKASLIMLPDAAKPENRWAEVLNVGPGFPNLMGQLEPSNVNVGDIVYVMAHGREFIDLSSVGGEEVYLASELDIMCKIEDLEKMTLKPLGIYIEVEKEESEVTASTVVVSQNRQTPANIGVVKSVGTGWLDISGNPIKHHVKVGDRVVFNPYHPGVIDMEALGFSERRYLIMHSDLYGIVETDGI